MANILYGVAWRLTLTAFPAGTQCVLFAFTACWPGLLSARTRPLPWRILIWFCRRHPGHRHWILSHLSGHSFSQRHCCRVSGCNRVGRHYHLAGPGPQVAARAKRHNPYPEDECRYFWVANTSGCVSPAFTSPKNFRRSAYSSWRKAISAIAKVRLMVTVFPWTLCFKL
jgi:hypothetical protein